MFSYLFSEYENHVVPQQSGISNQLIRVFNFRKNIADKVAEIFLDNLKEYSLVNGRNVLLIGSMKSAENDIPPNSSGISTIEIASVDVPTAPTSKYKAIEKQDDDIDNDIDSIKIPIPMKNKKVAYLIFPKDYTDQDMDKIARIVQAYKDMIGE